MKKALLFILFLLTPFIVFAYPKGDVNGDNKVDIMDYQKIRSHIIWAYYSKGDKTKLLTGDALKRADVNGKNGVDNGDYADVRKIILNNLNSTTSSTPSPTNTPKATATPQPTNSPKPATLTEAEKICESVKNNSSIDYKSFLSLSKKADSSDKYKDDYYAMKAAHDCANKYNKPVKITKGTYHIYKKNKETITVQTNTDLNNSTFYIHDESDIYNYMKMNIYTIKPNSNSECSKTLTLTNFNNNFDILPEKAGYSKSGYFFVHITEQNGTKVFNRNKGDGETVQSKAKSDRYRIKDGKVLDPMYWDYKNSKIEYEVCPIQNNQLEFKNATFKTVTRQKCEKCVNSKGKQTFKKRGISVQRSKTILSNIHHIFVDSNLKSTHEIYHSYLSFFAINKIADVTLEKCTIYAIGYKTAKGGYSSTYDLTITNSSNITLNKIKMYSGDGYNQLKNKKDWTVLKTSGCKNLTITNSKLNAIDAHKNIYNLTIKNTVVGSRGIPIVGTGDHNDNKLIIENVDFKYTSREKSVILLKDDYGTSWNGSITIKNSTIDSADVTSIIGAAGNKGTSTDNTNPKLVFNHPIYSPTKVTIDGLKIKINSSRLSVFNVNKSRFEYYYLKYFNKNKQNSWPKITGTKTITGVGTVTNYTL